MILHASIVGFKVANPDSQKREKVLSDCKKGELLMLEREYGNPHDSNAVAVLRLTREKIGYVSNEAAKKLADEIDSKKTKFEAVIESITGGQSGFFGSFLGSKEKPKEYKIAITKKY